MRIVRFSESFVGGFFGFGRTYGAVARFECQRADELTADWASALQATAEWRLQRGGRATTLHLYVDTPPTEVWAAAAFLASRVLVLPDNRPIELRGLRLEVAVFTPDMEQFFDLIVYPGAAAATERPHMT